MALDEQTRKKILDDHELAQRKVHEIVRSGENYFVLKERYLTPTHAYLKLPLHDSRGDVAYLSRVMSFLEATLATEKVDKTLAPQELPDYLRILIKEE